MKMESRGKILYKITGSIAAYKSTQVISRLMQAGFKVQTVVSKDALNFIGAATLEGLTGRPVYHDQFASGTMMSHINLVKWADLTIVAPATANTINRLAQGDGGTLLRALFVAHDWTKPYLIAPAMNTNMYTHPATQKSLKTLADWGVTVLPTAEGYLVCGDEGLGKLLEPEDLLAAIWEKFDHQFDKNPQILITSGGTRESVDAVRYLGNISTGRTGAVLADSFTSAGATVYFLHGGQSQLPALPCFHEHYSDAADLGRRLDSHLKNPALKAVIHLAAVSDYRPVQLQIGNSTINLPVAEKTASTAEKLSIDFRRNPKLADSIRQKAANQNLKLVAFKLSSAVTEKEQQDKVQQLQKNSGADLVVANDMQDRPGGRQQNFRVFSSPDANMITEVPNVAELGKTLANHILFKE